MIYGYCRVSSKGQARDAIRPTGNLLYNLGFVGTNPMLASLELSEIHPIKHLRDHYSKLKVNVQPFNSLLYL